MTIAVTATDSFETIEKRATQLCQLAIRAEDAYLAISIESNFGLGFAFYPYHKKQQNMKSITDFMNVARPLESFSLSALVNSDGYKKFSVSENDYFNVIYKLQKTITGESGKPRSFFHFTIGSNNDPAIEKCILKNDPQYGKYHFYFDDNQNSYHYLVVKAGSNNLPYQMGYKKLLMNICDSTSHSFLHSFMKGVVFYTYKSSSSPQIAYNFVKAIVNLSDDREILTKINRIQNIFDYKDFGTKEGE